MKKICLFGLGHIGLPTACLLATQGYEVVGIDTSEEVVGAVNRGEELFEEPELGVLLQDALTSNNLRAKTEPEAAHVFLITVPVLLNIKNKMSDLTNMRAVAEVIRHQLKKHDLVILESTVPLGTSEKVLLPLLEKSGLKCGRDFYLAHCPERAMPGSTVHEIIYNDRIIGGINRKSAILARELYSCFVKGNFYLTDLRTAEMVKLVENTSRDVNIALANEFAEIAEESGVNIWEIIELANKHPRVNILRPGPGVGGDCLPRDPWFLTENSTKSNRIVPLAREINNLMPNHVLTLAKMLLKGIDNPTITILGIAYKGDVDDTRETPVLKFIKLAQDEGFKVKIHDPVVKRFEYELYPLAEAAQSSDCLVIITDHTQFKQIDPEEISYLMRNRNVIDTRGILNQRKWRRAGFKLKVLGDGTCIS
ncbi:nucleotide sugar dehydrogenase [Chloroflexota bacterium]